MSDCKRANGLCLLCNNVYVVAFSEHKDCLLQTDYGDFPTLVSAIMDDCTDILRKPRSAPGFLDRSVLVLSFKDFKGYQMLSNVLIVKLAMESAVIAMIYSVCLSVCNTLVSCQNDSSYDHAVFTSLVVLGTGTGT